MKRFFSFSMVLVLLFMPVGLFAHSDSLLVVKARHFVDLLAKEKFGEAAADFDTRMSEALPAAKLQQIWAQLQAQAGPFQNILGVRKETKGSYQIVYVVCTFKKANLDAKIVFDKEQKIAGLFFLPSKGLQSWRPAKYANPNTFTELANIQIGKEWPLPATLSLPKGTGPFPAVVLVHGSGPNDRDESIGPNKPFRDLAQGLASRGIAVLRYEKRTRYYAQKMSEIKDTITVKEETIDDVLAALAFLRHQKKIDPAKIIVLGHSLGGTLIPRIAACDKGIAGFIIMAGATRPIEDLILEQSEYIFNLDGTLDVAEQTRLAEIRKSVQKAKHLTGSTKVDAQDLPFGLAASYWIDLNNYDLAGMARKIQRPVLVLQGQRDYQVTLKDFAGWKSALNANPNASFKVYPALNHLFIPGSGRSTPREYEQPGHVDAAVINDISRWIKSNF